MFKIILEYIWKIDNAWILVFGQNQFMAYNEINDFPLFKGGLRGI